MIPDRDQCLRACRSRDARFDGWFIVAVTSTGIYCRPSCPTPVPPKPVNMRFYPSVAAAQRAGYRACKRCRPDASPGSPEWNVRADLVGRAMRLIADGAVDRGGVPGLARTLAVSERHLHRLLVSEVGAGPLALARAQRAQTARVLIETTGMPFAEVAIAAGFASIRQFNDTIREVFAATPTTLRRSRQAGTARGGAGQVAVRLPFRRPYDAPSLLGFLGARAIRGVETWDGVVFSRTLRLPVGNGIAHLTAATDHIVCRLTLESVADLQAAVQRCRRLLDVDADPVAVAETLGSDPLLRPLVLRRPGLRAPGAVDGTEALVRAIVGQQVSVGGARTVLGRIAAAIGDPIDGGGQGLAYVFPGAERLTEAADAALPMPATRRRALRAACAAVADGRMRLDGGADRQEARRALIAITGIGPWTAEYVAMRALGDPDAFPVGDLGVRTALRGLGQDIATRDARRVADRWRPWRTYATHHLWTSLGGT